MTVNKTLRYPFKSLRGNPRDNAALAAELDPIAACIQFNVQSLTNPQKLQARSNIGLGTTDSPSFASITASNGLTVGSSDLVVSTVTGRSVGTFADRYDKFCFGSTQGQLASDFGLTWKPINNWYSGSADVGLYRAASNTLQVSNGSTANALGNLSVANVTSSGILTLPGAINAIQFSGNPYTTCLSKNTSDGNVYIGIVGNNTNRIGLSPGGQAVILGSGGYFGFSGTNLDASQAVTTRISQLNSNTVQIGTTANNALGNLACAGITAGNLAINSSGGVSYINTTTDTIRLQTTGANKFLDLWATGGITCVVNNQAGFLVRQASIQAWPGSNYDIGHTSDTDYKFRDLNINRNANIGGTVTGNTLVASSGPSVFPYFQQASALGSSFWSAYNAGFTAFVNGGFGVATTGNGANPNNWGVSLTMSSPGTWQMGTTGANANGSLIAKSIGFSSVSSNQGDIGWSNTTLDRWASDRKMTYIGGTLVMDSYANTCTIPIPLTQGYQTSSSDPTTTDIPLSRIRGWKNTTNGELRLWANDGGTLKSVLLS